MLNNETLGVEIRGQSPHDYSDNTVDTKTVLGEVKQNPYAIENLLLAIELLCIDSISREIRPTSKQVKFSPSSVDHLFQLYTDTTLSLMEFNINTEVLYMGEYYHEFEHEDDFPELFSVVDIDDSILNDVPYEVLEEYSYLVDNPFLLAQSFILTGNGHLINDYVDFSGIQSDDLTSMCITIPPIPDEPCPENCEWTLVATDETPDEGFIYEWICLCDYVGGGGVNNGNGPTLNDCGCPVGNDQRMPAGCINVENTLLNMNEGVDEVKVSSWKLFQSVQSTWTDANGCWEIDKSYKGRVHVWVDFINGDSFERKSGLSLKPITDYLGRFGAPDLNDLEQLYQMWSGTNDEIGSLAQRYWGAATINNQVKVYINGTNDLLPLKPFLDIVTIPDRINGSAPMKSPVLPFGIPDLFIGLEQAGTLDMQDLLFHELAHATHFELVGTLWWSILVTQTIENIVQVPNVVVGNLNIQDLTFEVELDFGDPWGDGDEEFAGYLALAESWAEHISNDFTMILNLENRVFFNGAVNGFVPVGLYTDLMDDTFPAETNVRLGIPDLITGYTRSQLFFSLEGATDLDSYRQNLLEILPPTMTENNLNDLITAYTQ